MDRKKSDLIYEKRELNKMSLDLYTLDKYNVLDSSIDKIINSLGEKLKNNMKQVNELKKLKRVNIEKYNDLFEKELQAGYSLEHQFHDKTLENIYIEEEITALLEVKVIYAFKHFEINLKKLIKYSYENEKYNKSKIYKWDSFVEYLSLKNINIKEIECYSEVNQLREINNAIKHSENYFESTKLKGMIPEFKGKYPTIRDLYRFYNRVKSSPDIFLQSLCSKISHDLYTFDEERIEKIAESFAVRMNSNDAQLLIDKLKKYY